MNLSGKFLYGMIENVPVYVLAGTGYCNEGTPMHDITFGVRVFQVLGVKRILFASPMCSVDASLKVGDIALVRDHVALAGRSSIFGHNEEKFGTRFPDVSEAYNKQLLQKLIEGAKALDINSTGIVFSHFIGPMFESFADANYASYIDTHAICTGIAPEVVAARHSKIKVSAIGAIISSITKEGIHHTTINKEMLNKMESLISRFVQE